MNRASVILCLGLACFGCKPAAAPVNNAQSNAEKSAPADPALPRPGLYRITESAMWLSGAGEIAPPAETATLCVPALDLTAFGSWAAGKLVPRCPSSITLGKGGFDAQASCTDPELGDIDVTSHAQYSPDSIDVDSDLFDGTDTMRISSAYRRVGDC